MQPIPLTVVDVVMSVYNQEKIITRILAGIIKNTTTPFNLVLVFDGCTDKSKELSLSFLAKAKPKLLKELRVTETPDVHENMSNNAGLRLCTSPYIVMLQDDMEICEMGWERRITFPLRSLPNVAIVGSRDTFDIVSMAPGKQVYENRAAREFFNLGRNTFAVRDYVNRGPIAFDRERLVKLNFLDERFAPCNLDDADLCLRAWKLYGWKSGVYWIDYYSPDGWSKTKQTPLSIRKEPASRAKNSAIIARDHGDYLASRKKHTEDINIPWKNVDYTPEVSRNSIAANLFLSQIRFIYEMAIMKVKSFFYRIKISKYSPLSPYRKSKAEDVSGESSEETRRRTEFI